MPINGAALTSISADSGSSSTDFITNDTTLTFRGTYTTGGSADSLGIWIDGTFRGLATLGAGNTWTFTFATPLGEGAHTIQYSHGSNLANTNDVIDLPGSNSITIDTTPDTAPTISIIDNVGTIQGQLLNNSVTDDTNLTVRVNVSGTGAVAGHRIQIFDGATQVGSTYTLTASDITNGFVDFATGTLSDGSSHTYTAKLTDIAGNVSSASAGLTTTIDTSAPVIVVNAVTGDDTLSRSESQAGYDVTGTATGANGQTITVHIVDEFDNSVIATQTATVAGGNWTVHFSGNLGIDGSLGHQFSIHASVTDAAGNTGTADHDFSVESTVCFMAGTQIMTPNGGVNVETLKRGDLVTTTDGRHMPVTWLGRQTVSRVFADPLRVLPIRIKAEALDENVPSRDLLISPDHAILLDGVLVQAGALVNGTSIVRETKVPQTYVFYHVELEDHSLILADNVASETFIDNVDRLAFDNWDEHLALYPSGKPISEMPYPRAQAYRQVPASIRARLANRAAAHLGFAASAA